VAGRYRGSGPATIRLTGKVNDQSQTYTYSNLTFVGRGGDEFIPRLWAQRKVGYLLTQIRLRGAKDELVKEVIALSTRYGIVTPYTSFLVQEPHLALTQAGRDQLSRGAGAPTAAPGAPAPAAPLQAAPRVGEKAVERAEVEKLLSFGDQAAAPAPGQAAAQVKQMGDRTFLFANGVWQDTVFDASRMGAESVAFGSERYFQLLTQHPEIGRYLALGDRVTVVIAGTAYAISPEGGAAAPVPAQATARPASPATATPAAAASPVPSAPAPLPPCPGAAALGISGLLAPLWLRRRRP
jgi:Ca-activated chloride channel family protein